MFGSLIILLILPFTDVSRIRSTQFRPSMKFFFWCFVINFFILMWIGSQHPVEPYVTIGQISTAVYFSYFLFIIPIISIIENTLFDLNTKSNSSKD